MYKKAGDTFAFPASFELTPRSVAAAAAAPTVADETPKATLAPGLLRVPDGHPLVVGLGVGWDIPVLGVRLAHHCKNHGITSYVGF